MEKLSASVKKERFLDVGTGTGLLAIAARMLGFNNVVGVDTDPLALEASRKNVSLNQLEGIELLEGDIRCAAGTYDMITANLISGTLIEIAGEIAARLDPSGVVIMSGILKGQDNEVAAAAEKAGLRCVERLRDGKWVTLACRH
jgi:ribosomal protein L11 methyltransferase